ncbi:DUF4184 family protein [Paenibacillus tarimensis]
MPFTFAHPLYAAPLKLVKPKYFSLTGIVLGSMAPDFEYFIRFEPYQSIGHTNQGLFFHAIPLSILFAYLFHLLIKAPLSIHLPSLFNIDGRAQMLMREWKLDSIRSWAVFIVSVTIGFYLHILLDGFTHQSGYFATRLVFLQHDIIGIPLYKLLQLGLSLIGLLVEAIIIIFILWNTPITGKYILVRTRDKFLFWAQVLGTSLVCTLLKVTLSSSVNYIGILVVAPITGFFLGLIFASILYRIRSDHKILGG